MDVDLLRKQFWDIRNVQLVSILAKSSHFSNPAATSSFAFVKMAHGV
jgi:hypothetical protein